MAKKILSIGQIKKLAKDVVDQAKKDKMPISKVYVFGSYAKKRATEHSDLDLCFISSKFTDTLKAEVYLRTKIHFIFKPEIPMDIVAYSPKEFKKEIPLVSEVMKTGTRIY